jgi:peroxiredoxin Q/BCP
MLDVGDKVPSYALPSSNGNPVAVTDFKSKKIVLYFYPKDDTPGCTTEACDFRDTLKTYQDLNVEIIGVSKDAGDSHEKFIAKYDLPFTLLSDEDLKLMLDFGVWKEKSMYGKTFLGIERSTFLLDETGVIVKAWHNVKATGHVAKVLEEIQKM